MGVPFGVADRRQNEEISEFSLPAFAAHSVSRQQCLYAEASDPTRPVVCFDESPFQLIGEVLRNCQVYDVWCLGCNQNPTRR